MTASVAQKLEKKERIDSRTLIERLFAKGESRSMSFFPLRIVYMYVDKTELDATSLQMMVSVSKKHFKRAVKRNRVKRQIRDSFRRNKMLLASSTLDDSKTLAIAFIWLSDELYSSAEIEKKMKALMQRINEQ